MKVGGSDWHGSRDGQPVEKKTDKSRKHYIRRRQSTSTKIINRRGETMTSRVENTADKQRRTMTAQTTGGLNGPQAQKNTKSRET